MRITNNNDYKKYRDLPLFLDIRKDDFEALYSELNMELVEFEEGEIVAQMGDPIIKLCTVVTGKLKLCLPDVDGNPASFTWLEEGHIGGAIYYLNQMKTFPVTVIAGKSTSVLSFDLSTITNWQSISTPYQAKFFENFLMSTAGSVYEMMNKHYFSTRRSTADKLLSFLSSYAKKVKSYEFTLPYSRMDLAEFLCVDRAALSVVIGKLADKSYFKTRSRHFVLNEEHFTL